MGGFFASLGKGAASAPVPAPADVAAPATALVATTAVAEVAPTPAPKPMRRAGRKAKAEVAELPLLSAELAPAALPAVVVAPRLPVAAEPWLEPGLHLGIAAERYHADRLAEVPTLSSSLAKVILDKTPRHARMAHPRLNPTRAAREDEGKFDLGHAAHELILGRGGGFEVLGYDSYKRKAAQDARDDARAAGRTPILEEQYERALVMRDSVRAVLAEHEGCEHVFDPDHGAAEVVAIWRDEGGPLCRAMIDWLSRDVLNIVDLKTTAAGLDDESVSRTIENLGYDTSAGFYLRALPALFPHLAGRFGFRWVFVEDEAPHEARVFTPNREMLAIGDRKAALGIAKWDRALTSGVWPGWPRRVEPIGYPTWGGEKRWMPREERDPDADRMAVSTQPRPQLAPAEDEPDPIHGEYPRNADGRYGA